MKCDICGEEITKEMERIITMLDAIDDPCYCGVAKDVLKLKQQNNKLKKTLGDVRRRLKNCAEQNERLMKKIIIRSKDKDDTTKRIK